jgi:hypothetical protein
MNEYDFYVNLEEIWEGWIDQTQDEMSRESVLNTEELDELEQTCF